MTFESCSHRNRMVNEAESYRERLPRFLSGFPNFWPYAIALPTRGAYHDRHERGTGLRWTWKRLDERRESVRQRCVVLTPRSWRLRWQQYKAHRGEHVISRKAIAQGMPDVLRCPVCSCAPFLPTLRMRPRVQRASGIPCALWILEEGEEYLQTSGASCRENAKLYQRHCERSEAIHHAP